MSAVRPDSQSEALSIVDVEYPLADDSVNPDIEGCPKFGDLIPLRNDEREQLESLRNLIVRFVEQEKCARPLCVAVFGPPGSGKSFAVKQLKAEVSKCSDVKLDMTTINLTQVSSSDELSHTLHAAKEFSRKVGSVPLVFLTSSTLRETERLTDGWLGFSRRCMMVNLFVAVKTST